MEPNKFANIKRVSAARRGFVLIYITIAMVVILGIVSLAVDVGRVQVAKTELQAASDAALLYGAEGFEKGLSVSDIVDRCADAADDNSADGTAISLNKTKDIEFGTWNATTKEFHLRSGNLRAYANALRVNARRTASGGNAVPLFFAGLVGRNTCDVQASATAMITRVSAGGDYGFIGLDQAELIGSVVTDSYNSAPGGATGGLEHGSVLSNGNMSITGSVTVHGDARPGVGKTLSLDPDALVTGSTAPLSAPLTWAVPDPGNAATVNDNASIPGAFLANGGKDLKIGNNKTLTLGAGTYYVRDLELSGGGTLKLTGEATIYVYRDLDLGGNTSANGGNRPKDLKIRMTSAGDVKLHGTTDMIVDLIAPLCEVVVSGTPDISGRIVGKTLRVNGNVDLHYDESLGVGDTGITGPAVCSLVE